MRILILHSTYLSGWTSGENSVVRDEERVLKEAGHDVASWTPSPGPDVSHARLGARTIWSPAALSHVRNEIESHRPEIVHVHNLYPMLSPAVLRVGRHEGPRVVMTLHNYRMLCLPATCFRDGEICERCVGRVPWRGVAYRCYRGSALGSAALATSLTVHRSLRTLEHVSRFLAVSNFVRDKHVEAGFAPQRVLVKPNFSWPRARRQGAGEYFLYAGRLTPEKDVALLVDAWRATNTPAVVVGDGPQSDALRRWPPMGGVPGHGRPGRGERVAARREGPTASLPLERAQSPFRARGLLGGGPRRRQRRGGPDGVGGPRRKWPLGPRAVRWRLGRGPRSTVGRLDLGAPRSRRVRPVAARIRARPRPRATGSCVSVGELLDVAEIAQMLSHLLLVQRQ